MNYVAPVTKSISVLFLLICLCAGLPFNQPTTAESDNGFASQRDWRGQLDDEYPALSRYATDLSLLALRGKLDLARDRDGDISRVVTSLSTTTRAPLVVGEFELDRDAIASGVAIRIASGDVPDSLRNKRVFSLSLEALARGAKTSEEFVKRVQAVFAEVEKAQGRIVLFVDQLHQYAGARAMPVASATVKAAIEAAHFLVIGGATPEAYSTYIASDESLDRLFEPISIACVSESIASATIASDKISEGFEGDKISPDVRELIKRPGADGRVAAILQVDDVRNREVTSLLRRYGIKIDVRMAQLGAMKVELPAKAIEEMAKSGATNYISPDRKMESFGHVTSTTGADAVRVTNGTYTTGLDGTGIGIAVLDSGVDSNHTVFLDRSNKLRVIVSRDFTGKGRIDDPYGHGTHVASIAAGNARISNAQYTGIAPNANLINLRVLGATGSGTVSAVLSALDWVMTNRATYNIRVVNISLGEPAIDSYKNDPICRAVRRLVDAGIVVVAAAGNNGKNGAGQKVYGQIHSPGNEPSAITVGAANSYGTDQRNDDGITSFSSRGPTRSYWTDATGLKHYDNLIKPDLVAPGNKLIDAEAANNYLVTQNPSLDAGVSPVYGRRMMFMNGSSMAAPIAAGAAALLLQANPNLTPNMIKALLMYTAQPLAGFNMFEQGAGEINIEGAVRVARLVRADLTSSTAVGAPLLTTSSPAVPQTTIAGHAFNWSQGLILNYNYATGVDLITKYQGIYNVGALIGDGSSISNGVLIGDPTQLSSGVLFFNNIMTSSGAQIGDGTVFMSSGVLIGDGVLTEDGVLIGDGVLTGDGVFRNDAMTQAQSSTTNGDSTRKITIVSDTGVDYPGY